MCKNSIHHKLKRKTKPLSLTFKRAVALPGSMVFNLAQYQRLLDCQWLQCSSLARLG